MSPPPAEPEADPEPIFFQINTGSTSGTYYPMGEMLAAVISHPIGSIACQKDRPCGPRGLIVSAQASGGSVENVMEVDAGVSTSGLAQADIVSWAAHSKNLFRGQAAYSNLRVVANLYPESIHLVTLAGSGIYSVADLQGRSVSIDRPGSGTNYDARMILDSFGLKAHHLEIMEVDPNMSADRLLTGEIDAFFFLGGAPLRAVMDLAEQGQIELVPISGEPIEDLLKVHDFFQIDTIAAGTYPGIRETPTLSVGALWIINVDVEDDIVYAITKALWASENRSLLDHGHVKGSLLTPEAALEGLPIELHPGAARYYREVGLIPSDT
jgi:TRAP transporter TAXI family solute receptor